MKQASSRFLASLTHNSRISLCFQSANVDSKHDLCSLDNLIQHKIISISKSRIFHKPLLIQNFSRCYLKISFYTLNTIDTFQNRVKRELMVEILTEIAASSRLHTKRKFIIPVQQLDFQSFGVLHQRIMTRIKNGDFANSKS